MRTNVTLFCRPSSSYNITNLLGLHPWNGHTHTGHILSTAFYLNFSLPRTSWAALWDNLTPWTCLLAPSLGHPGICWLSSRLPQPSHPRLSALTKESVSITPLSISHITIFKPSIYSLFWVCLPSLQKMFGRSDFLLLNLGARPKGIKQPGLWDEAGAGSTTTLKQPEDQTKPQPDPCPAIFHRFQCEGIHEWQLLERWSWRKPQGQWRPWEHKKEGQKCTRVIDANYYI